MKRIKIIQSFQGNGMTRVINDAWQHLIKLDDGYFEKIENNYNFYTNDGLLLKAEKNSNDYMAIHFGAKDNLLFVDYTEIGPQNCIMEEIPSSNNFLYRSHGFFNEFGNSFFIKLELYGETTQINIPEVYYFQIVKNESDFENLKHFLSSPNFEQPKSGELLSKTGDNPGEIIIIFKTGYYRKLRKQICELVKTISFDENKELHTTSWSFKVAKLTNNLDGFVNFDIQKTKAV